MRQGALIQMQRDLGNRKARQMVPVPVAPAGKAPAIQRDTLDQSLTGVGAPIAGLKRGDGLKYGTYDKRDRVSILQVQLNEKMMANIRVDGKFGPRTEEVLGEFQESVDLAPSPVVDPVTADLLMSESEPEPIPGPQGETVHPNFVSSGESLKSASINIFMTSLLLSTCGTLLQDPNDPGRQGAATMLIASDTNLANASNDLQAAGSDLIFGDEESIHTAGLKMTTAGQQLMAAGFQISAAGNLLAMGQSPTDAAAGRLLTNFADELIVAAQKIEWAGFKLQDHEDRRKPIGDPIVGLRKGDGLIYGTRNRRDRVRLLQEKLNDKDKAGLVPDGKFGDLTTAALHSFQSLEGLPESDRVDSATAKALRAAPSTSEEQTPLQQAGESLIESADILESQSLQLDSAGNILSAGLGPTDGPAGQQMSQASEQFISAGSNIRAAGEGLKDIK